jgi:hypothetical protein
MSIDWPDEQRARLRKLRASGLEITVLAERFGVSCSAIKSALGHKFEKPTGWGGYVPIVPTRMVIGEWFIDPADGCRTRIVRAE